MAPLAPILSKAILLKNFSYPLLAFLVFLGVNHLLKPVFPSGYQHGMEVKRRHILEKGAEYDTLFLGSSRVCYGLDPALFDEKMKAGGQPSKTFNLAMDGVRHYEAIYLLEKILENQSMPSLKRVFLEVQQCGPLKIREKNLYKARMVNWHDGDMTHRVIRDIAVDSKMKGGEKALSASQHFLHFCHRLSNLGRARLLFVDWLEEKDRLTPSAVQEERALGPGGVGFASLDLVGNEKNRDKYHEKPEEHQKTVDWIAAWHKRDMTRYGSLPMASQELNQQSDWLILNQLLKKHGVELVLVIPPIMSPAPYIMKPLMQQDQIPYFIFNDPDSFPEFYDLAYRFDRAHLNEKGAEYWTSLLAEKMLSGEFNP